MSSALLVSDQDRLVSDAKETAVMMMTVTEVQFLVQSQKYQTLMDVPKYGDALFLHYQIMRSVHLNLSVSAIC